MSKFQIYLGLIFCLIAVIGYGFDVSILKVLTFTHTKEETDILIQLLPFIIPVLLAYGICYVKNKAATMK